jgi:hypothetical protein
MTHLILFTYINRNLIMTHLSPSGVGNVNNIIRRTILSKIATKMAAASTPFTMHQVPASASAKEKLDALRTHLHHHSLHAYIIPSEDAHQSEYIAACDSRRAFISGFTGSAGFAVVTREGEAAVWTDGRYFNQAEKQLDGQCWKLMKAGLPETLKREEWLLQVS